MDFERIIGLIFPLAFFFFFLWIFRRIAKTVKKAGGMQKMEELAKKRAAIEVARQKAGQSTQPITLQELLGMVEQEKHPTKNPPYYERSEVEAQASEVELDHSIEDDLPTYDTLIPLSQQMEAETTGSIESTLPHYERTEGIQSVGHHPIYGKKGDMLRTQTAAQQDAVMLAGQEHGLTRSKKKGHPLKKHLKNPTNFRMAFLTSILLERKGDSL